MASNGRTGSIPVRGTWKLTERSASFLYYVLLGLAQGVSKFVVKDGRVMRRVKEEYVEAARTATSIAGMCRNLGLKPCGGNYRIMHNAIKYITLTSLISRDRDGIGILSSDLLRKNLYMKYLSRGLHTNLTS